MAANAHLDLRRIEADLQSVETKFDEINSTLGAHRDPLERSIIENMLAGYSFIEWLATGKIDIFAMGHHKHMLELNRIVLFGAGAARRREYRGQITATERRFYDERNAGIEDLVEWYRLHARRPVWERAAGVYIRILSTPQLFIEGNQRTGALVMSYVLMREGEPPFVLTVDNAIDYFEPSTVIRDTRKNSLTAMVRLPGIRRRFVRLLQRHSAEWRQSSADRLAGSDACGRAAVH